MFTEEISFVFLDEPITVIAGKDALQNQQLILDSDENDMWFHVANYPSSHLVMKIHNIKLSKKELRKVVVQGARQLKKLSKYSSIKNLEFNYTLIKNVKITNIIGRVTINNYKSIVI